MAEERDVLAFNRRQPRTPYPTVTRRPARLRKWPGFAHRCLCVRWDLRYSARCTTGHGGYRQTDRIVCHSGVRMLREASFGNKPTRPKKLAREIVTYAGNEPPGTIVVRSKQRRLYFVVAELRRTGVSIGDACESGRLSSTPAGFVRAARASSTSARRSCSEVGPMRMLGPHFNL
jgi:hypothetical protein